MDDFRAGLMRVEDQLAFRGSTGHINRTTSCLVIKILLFVTSCLNCLHLEIKQFDNYFIYDFWLSRTTCGNQDTVQGLNAVIVVSKFCMFFFLLQLGMIWLIRQKIRPTKTLKVKYQEN